MSLTVFLCVHAGVSCKRGTSCVYNGNYLDRTNYTACQQPAPEGSCLCLGGPVPVGTYCFVYGMLAFSMTCLPQLCLACQSTAQPIMHDQTHYICLYVYLT